MKFYISLLSLTLLGSSIGINAMTNQDAGSLQIVGKEVAQKAETERKPASSFTCPDYIRKAQKAWTEYYKKDNGKNPGDENLELYVEASRLTQQAYEKCDKDLPEAQGFAEVRSIMRNTAEGPEKQLKTLFDHYFNDLYAARNYPILSPPDPRFIKKASVYRWGIETLLLHYQKGRTGARSSLYEKLNSQCNEDTYHPTVCTELLAFYNQTKNDPKTQK